MKTEELEKRAKELSPKTKEELIDLLLKAQDLGKMYSEMYYKESEKFSRYRDAVRSVVLFID
jgi:hypothetical protein